MLRALYPTCAIPGCERAVLSLQGASRLGWEHGGPTDLDNLLPLCNRHHQHFVHDKGWKLKLLPDRTLEITLPDGDDHDDRPAEPRRRDANGGWAR